MKVGDLVAFGSRICIIVEDHTMWSDQSFLTEPYLCRAMKVYTGGKIERVVYAELSLVDESR